MRIRKLTNIISTFLISTLLTSCNSNIKETITDPINNAIPNLWITLAQLGSFGITVFIFFKFFYKPIKEKINKRNEKIKNDLDDANKIKNQAIEKNEIAESNIKDSKIEADKIIKNAQESAKLEASRIIDDAKEKADLNIQQAHVQMEKEKEIMEKEFNEKIVSLSLDISKEIIGRELTSDDNNKIVEEFISNIEDK